MPIPASFDLSGRVALVTGAGSPDGIGFAAARLLAELGAAVMIGATTSRIHDRVSELRGRGFDVAGVAGDLTHPGAASALVSAALDRWGRLDIVVNNAGMISAAVPMFESGTLDSMDQATWQAALARNLTTAFLVTKAALPAMMATRMTSNWRLGPPGTNRAWLNTRWISSGLMMPIVEVTTISATTAVTWAL